MTAPVNLALWGFDGAGSGTNEVPQLPRYL